MKQPIVLKVFKGEQLEAVRQFEHSQIIIGKGGDAQLELTDEGVALLHAMIEDRGDEYFISDLGSQSGTLKNGARVLEDRLSSGDELTVGPYRIQFYIGVPKPAAPPKPVAPPSVSPVNAVNAVQFNDNSKQPETAPAAAAPVSEPTPAVVVAPVVPEIVIPELVADVPAVAAAPAPNAPKPAAPVVNPPPVNKIKKNAGGAVTPPITRNVGAAAAPAAAASVPKKAALPPIAQSHKTFAPPNPYADAREIIRPHKGSTVEVLVTWNHKVLSTNTFRQGGSIYISSSPDADVFVPIVSSRSKYELLKISGQITVCLTQEMTGELTTENGQLVTFAELNRQSRIRNVGTHFELDVRQGEMARIGLQNELISIYVRYIADGPKPIGAPQFDVSSPEVTGVILALMASLIMGVYMSVYTPSPLAEDEAKQEQPVMHRAIVQFKPPPKKEVEPVVEKPPEPPKPTPVPPKQVVKVTDTKAEVKKQTKNIPAKTNAGKAAELAPNPNANPTKKMASNNPGGAKKTAPKEGANMQSEKPDPTKTGLAGMFASKGMQKQVSKAYSGSGELQGMAEAATGYAGSAEDRQGDSFGSKIKDVGSGKGSSTVGITGGIGTKGRGNGGTGYGTGGLGQKGNSNIEIEGSDAEVPGGMDKEAIRRVIREHLREIRNCYNNELQRAPDLFGKVVIEWDIEDGGKVTRSAVKSNGLANNNVGNCIASHLKMWKFPDPPAGQIGRVSYPFVFSAQ